MMRFHSRKKKPLATRPSTSASPTPSTAPSPPRPRSVVWRSLWSRVRGQWMATPIQTQVFKTEPPRDTKPVSAPHGLREYFQRKRGERWFLMRRRPDCELHATGDAEEVEMSPPPLVATSESPDPANRPLASTVSPHSDSVSSELEVNMSSYSRSSHSSSGDEIVEEDDDVNDRDSYATNEGNANDPFLQRYSSWCSIDDEQTTRNSGDDEAKANEDEAQEDEGDVSEDHGQSPTLEALYGVHHVDLGNPTADCEGVWV